MTKRKLKPRDERAAAVRRGECLVDGCTRPIHAYGHCRECLGELNASMEQGAKAMRDARLRGSN